MELSFQTVSVSCLEEVKRRSSEADRTSNRLLDNSFIESAIFGLFRIDLINYIKVKSILAKEFHIQPSELDRMPAWEYELFMKEINNAVKEENERNQKEMDKSGIDKAQKMSDPKYIERMQQNSIPKMPDFGSFKMPSMPKL